MNCAELTIYTNCAIWTNWTNTEQTTVSKWQRPNVHKFNTIILTFVCKIWLSLFLSNFILWDFVHFLCCGILSCGILSCGILSVGILSCGILSCGILSRIPVWYIEIPQTEMIDLLKLLQYKVVFNCMRLIINYSKALWDKTNNAPPKLCSLENANWPVRWQMYIEAWVTVSCYFTFAHSCLEMIIRLQTKKKLVMKNVSLQ